MATAFLGSVLGALVASRLPRRRSLIVLVALVLVGGYVLFRPRWGRSPQAAFAGLATTPPPRWAPVWYRLYDGCSAGHRQLLRDLAGGAAGLRLQVLN